MSKKYEKQQDILPIVRPPEPPKTPDQPKPPLAVVAPPPDVLHTPEMDSTNDNYCRLINREIRENVMIGQKRKSDGRIFIEVYMANGVINGAAKVMFENRVRLGR